MIPLRRKLALAALGMVAVIVLAIVYRQELAQQIVIFRGKRAVASHRATPIDLTSKYEMRLSGSRDEDGSSPWDTIPVGFQVFDNVPLDIGGAIFLWGAINATNGEVSPEQVLGIKVEQKFEMLYVYHGAFFTSRKGTPVYALVFRYEDGSSATNEILYGRDILQWGGGKKETVPGPTGHNSKLAWVGGSFTPGGKARLRFILTAIKNPRPDLEVMSIDLYSRKSDTGPAIMAMTAGKSGLMK